MSKILVEKACPYCGQMRLCGEEDRPEMSCLCEMALMVQNFEKNTEKLLLELADLFGENCREKYPEFQPVSEEQYGVMAAMVDLVGHGRMGNISFLLPDGCKVKISAKGLERSKVIVRKAVVGNG